MNKEILNRIEIVVKKLNISKNEFCKKANISHNFFHTSGNITMKTLMYIIQAFPQINSHWLMTGEGEVFLENKPTHHYSTKDNIVIRPIPYVNKKSIDGFGKSDFKIKEKDIECWYSIPAFNHLHADFMIDVSGDSMYPTLNGGDIIACKIVKDINVIMWNSIYVISHKDEGLIIKRIVKSNKSHHIILRSDNTYYADIEVHLNKIDGLARVLGIVKLLE